MVTSLKVKFLGEVIDCLFKAHTERKSSKWYKFSAVLGIPI